MASYSYVTTSDGGKFSVVAINDDSVTHIGVEHGVIAIFSGATRIALLYPTLYNTVISGALELVVERAKILAETKLVPA